MKFCEHSSGSIGNKSTVHNNVLYNRFQKKYIYTSENVKEYMYLSKYFMYQRRLKSDKIVYKTGKAQAIAHEFTRLLAVAIVSDPVRLYQVAAFGRPK